MLITDAEDALSGDRADPNGWGVGLYPDETLDGGPEQFGDLLPHRSHRAGRPRPRRPHPLGPIASAHAGTHRRSRAHTGKKRPIPARPVALAVQRGWALHSQITTVSAAEGTVYLAIGDPAGYPPDEALPPSAW